MSFRRLGEDLHCQVDVLWSHVHPIWHTIQALCNGSRLGSRELPGRNILVHIITVIVKVHFAIFNAVNRRRTWNTCSCFGTNSYICIYIGIDIINDIGCDIEDAPKRCFVHSILHRYRRKTFEIVYDILFRRFLYIRY
jgi:hypothetical protein